MVGARAAAADAAARGETTGAAAEVIGSGAAAFCDRRQQKNKTVTRARTPTPAPRMPPSRATLVSPLLAAAAAASAPLLEVVLARSVTATAAGTAVVVPVAVLVAVREAVFCAVAELEEEKLGWPVGVSSGDVPSVRVARAEGVAGAEVEAVPVAAGDALRLPPPEGEPLPEPVAEGDAVELAVKHAEGVSVGDKEAEAEAVAEAAPLGVEAPLREARPEAQCVVDCDEEPESDTPPGGDAVPLAPRTGEALPPRSSDAEEESEPLCEGAPVGEPRGGAEGAGAADDEAVAAPEKESTGDPLCETVPRGEEEWLGDAAVEPVTETEPEPDVEARSEGVPGPTDTHCVVDAVAVKHVEPVAVALRDGERVPVPEANPGMEGDAEMLTEKDEERDAEAEGVAGTRRLMVFAPLSATYSTWVLAS